MTVGGISSYNMDMSMRNISTGKRINSAADDAAGLAIVQKMQSQVTGTDQGTKNTYDMKNALQTGDGALSSIQESLQRIREIGVMSQNAIMTDDNKAALQMEVDALKSHIKDTAVNTEFNGIKLLDGTFADKNLASNPSGGGMKISIENTTLENLGIKDFDVTQNFSLETIDSAIEKVSTARSNIGATNNRMESTISYNNIASENLVRSQSQIEDADIASQVINANRNQILETYKSFMQKQQSYMQVQAINLLA
jgi:flagellin